MKTPMKRIISILSGLLFACFIFGQTNIEDLERVNGRWTLKGKKSPYTGDFIEYYADGKVKGKGTFKKGFVHGLRTQYYENGVVSLERYYANGINEGSSIEYYPSGQMKQESFFKKGKENGIAKVFYEDGQVYVILTFIDGVQQGDYFEYFPDGRLKAQYYFVDGIPGYSQKFLDLTERALTLSRQFKLDKAIELYDKAIEINPTVAQIYFNRGACKGNNFNFEEAIEDYNKAIELKPDYMEAYANRGNAKINMLTTKGNLFPSVEETASACEDFHKAIELGDTSISTSDKIYLYCNGGLEESEDIIEGEAE